jgi:hypothetical protein
MRRKKFLVAFLALGVVSSTSGQQGASPPPDPADNGPSLETTLQFIQNKLGEQGAVGYYYEIHHPHSKYKVFKSVWLTDISSDAASCQLNFRWHQTEVRPSIDDQIKDITVSSSLQLVQSLEVMTAEHYQMAESVYGNPSQPAKVSSPAFVLVTRVKPKLPDLQTHYPWTDFYFNDESVANRVAKAMTHAVDLCGGGKTVPDEKEPF